VATQDLTALDWIAILLTGGLALVLFLFPMVVAPPMRTMLADLGGEVPRLTQLALGPWLTPTFGAGAVALLAMAGSGRVVRRRAAVVAAFMWAAFGLTLAVVALYLPIFQLAGNVE
jgi:type II secretory pathway component PulF